MSQLITKGYGINKAGDIVVMTPISIEIEQQEIEITVRPTLQLQIKVEEMRGA